MRLLLLIIVGTATMINGQEAKPHADKRHSIAENNDSNGSAGRPLTVGNQQAPQGQESSHSTHPQSYLRELLLPPNVLTLALVIVGIVGIIVALCSLGKIDKQIGEMRRQVDVTMLQLRAMHEQVTEMSQQTQSLREYVDYTKTIADAALESARAAKASAEATRDNVAIVISKEKPRISITLEDLTLVIGLQSVKYELRFSGMTPAYILSSGAISQIFDSEQPPGVYIWVPPMYNLPPIIKPTETTRWNGTAFVFPNLALTQSEVDEVIAAKKFIHCWGFIKYRDAFCDVTGKDRQTSFRFVWNFFPAHAFYGETRPIRGYWRQIGGQEENAET